ncbi:AraC family transcriptional regulator [Emticicia aquatilis]|uniref:AraC family transcriptional regulator n=1 Tax=Emticicia aquatilis TaxID=1537369 RepID=A0A916Z3N1_9BACT|nr:helix-turn-helix domain-containing protein [Emticicia aquatilis]GGD75361.1 AraC family transcriptional regulator [Emticicia aquatilis]
MNVSELKSCYIGPQISPEQFISEHFFLYLISGTINYFDGNKEFKVKTGDYGIIRRNHLVKYNKMYDDEQKFKKIIVTFDQVFLKKFNEQYKFHVGETKIKDAILRPKPTVLVENFVYSLTPYFTREGVINPDFFDLKRSELLLILLKENPEYINIFFDFGIPEKLDIEAFMNKNYKFNVSIERFAYLTGRSLSAFKRDFERIFNQTPSRWLVQKRLHEAHFLIEKKNKKPTEIYLDLGFEDLSHFSFAFKKMFGYSPSQV